MIIKFKIFETVSTQPNPNYFRRNNTSDYTTQEFKYWSDNKEELEAILDGEKYNL